jgi:hypothetical protein
MTWRSRAKRLRCNLRRRKQGRSVSRLGVSVRLMNPAYKKTPENRSTSAHRTTKSRKQGILPHQSSRSNHAVVVTHRRADAGVEAEAAVAVLAEVPAQRLQRRGTRFRSSR